MNMMMSLRLCDYLEYADASLELCYLHFIQQLCGYGHLTLQANIKQKVCGGLMLRHVAVLVA